jgi:hypothetical protein
MTVFLLLLSRQPGQSTRIILWGLQDFQSGIAKVLIDRESVVGMDGDVAVEVDEVAARFLHDGNKSGTVPLVE